MSHALNFLFRRRKPWLLSKHGTAGEECTAKCHVCGATPTLWIVFRKGYCKAHKAEADAAGVENMRTYPERRFRRVA